MTDTSAFGREGAIASSTKNMADGRFIETLARRVAMPTESQNPSAEHVLYTYLSDEIQPILSAMGFTCRIYDNPQAGQPPLLIGERIESEDLPTLLTYGHGDVTNGETDRWQEGTHPWQLAQIGDQIFGRGTADNKGQHTINLFGLEAALAAREGRLGYNVKVLFEMSEEVGSKGLEAFCAAHKEELKADLFLASDGPRLNAEAPTIFLGSRGVCQFRLRCVTGNGARHSGNWGGIITNPAVRLQHALSTLVSPMGRVLPDSLRAPKPEGLTAEMMQALPVGGKAGDPTMNPSWGEPELTDGERLFGSNTLEIIALGAGNIDQPVGAIPNQAEAVCHLRIVPGTQAKDVPELVKAHLAELGFDDIEVVFEGGYNATRLDPEHPWVGFVKASMERSLEQTVTVLPNLGGTIPNHCFADVLELPTVWMPHSYPSCKQHAPDEHLLASVAEQGLAATAGLFWDLGEHWPS